MPAIQQASQAAGLLLAGLAQPEARQTMRPGDSVTILVSLTKGEKLKQWLIVFSMEEPRETEKRRGRDSAHVYTSTGHEFRFDGGRAGIRIAMIGPLSASDAGRQAAKAPAIIRQRVLVDADYLALGMEQVPATMMEMRARKAANPSLPQGSMDFGPTPYPPGPAAANAKVAEAVGITAASERAFIGSVLALQEFLQLASRTPGLKDVFMSVLDVPWWSIVASAGNMKFDIQGMPFQRQLDSGSWGLPADEPVYAAPYLLGINGKPALLFQLAMTAPKAPLTVSAGIVGLAAGAPDGKGPVLTMQVIGSRAGEAPASP
ncbi:MAG: hypothetical protein ABI222_04925 [Opitutaceae bacterium]